MRCAGGIKHLWRFFFWHGRGVYGVDGFVIYFRVCWGGVDEWIAFEIFYLGLKKIRCDALRGSW